jgi:hypothetical protein
VSGSCTDKRKRGRLRWIKVPGRVQDETPPETAGSESVLPSHYHAAVWIDHHEARVVHFNADDVDEKTVHPPRSSGQLHHRSGSAAGTHARGEATYFRSVADALGEAKEFIVAGPSTAKTEFVTWLRSEVPLLAERLCGVETLPQLTDKQLVAEARRFFTGADRMRPQTT